MQNVNHRERFGSVACAPHSLQRRQPGKWTIHGTTAMVTGISPIFHYAPQPNWGFNADANMGHAFGIFMAHVGTLRTSCSGAG